jgi:5-methylcytosine-specific restriction endonuclease McrA
MNRVPIPQRVRFEVFKRDSFTCQYCGRKAPDVILNCDHIRPVAEGGENDPLNLLTSCRECNGGKGAIPLADSAMLDKQRAMLEDLEERRQQIEMMIQWRDELAR